VGVGRLTAAVAAAAAFAWAVWFEPRRLVVHRRTLWLPHWPARYDRLVVVVASDFHAGGPHVDGARVERIARRLARAKPDLALLLGDFVDHRVLGGGNEPPEAVGRALAPLRPPLGIWGVLGNHDWNYGGERVREGLEASGVQVLEDDAVEIAHNLWLAGLADPTERRPEPHKAFGAVPEGAALLVLLHDPDLFPSVPERAALTVAGHTHGGQVDLPLIKNLVIPSRFGGRYDRGVKEERGRLLLVTSGVGESRWPIRLRRPPEALVLTLRPRASRAPGR
jgi:uncharacterized protein